MNDELRESIFNLIKGLDTLAEVKKVLKVNDVNGAAAESFIARWNGREIPEPTYPGKKLVVENKAIEEAPVVKEVEPEVLVTEEPEILVTEVVDILVTEVAEAVAEEPEAVEESESTPSYKFRR
jgi:hypothetical protein